jgi:hypothetical protein
MFWQGINLWQDGQISVFVGSIDSFKEGFKIPEGTNDLHYKIIMVYKVLTAKMEDTVFISVYDVMDLL